MFLMIDFGEIIEHGPVVRPTEVQAVVPQNQSFGGELFFQRVMHASAGGEAALGFFKKPLAGRLFEDNRRVARPEAAHNEIGFFGRKGIDNSDFVVRQGPVHLKRLFICGNIRASHFQHIAAVMF